MAKNSTTKNLKGRISEIFIGMYFFTSSIAIGQTKYIEGQVLNVSDSISISDVHFITSMIFHEYLDEINNVFLFDHIIDKRGFLNPNNLEMWDFKIDGYTFYNDKNVIVIRTKLIDNLKNTLHESKIYINEEDYGILKLDFKYQWKKRSFIKTNIDSLWIDDVIWKGRANYIKDGDTYSLSYLDYSNEKIVCKRDLMRNFSKLYKYEILCDFTSIH